MRAQLVIAALLVLAPGAWTQAAGEPHVEPSVWRAWTPRLSTSANLAAAPLGARRAPLVAGASLAELAVPLDPVAQELAYVLDPRPVWTHREDLEGAKEERQRYERLPGGIVLGLSATASGLSADVRVTRAANGALVLAGADGRAFALPAVDPALLAACLEFVGSGDGSDALIDLAPDGLRVAPAFRGTSFERVLVRADRAPHRFFPRTALWKSVIVDRAVTLALRADAVVLDADLEVRFYGRGSDETEPSARVLTLALEDAPTAEGPTGSAVSTLSDELAPLSEIAGWLGFLRRVEQQDPQGFRALRGASGPPPPVSACSHEQR